MLPKKYRLQKKENIHGLLLSEYLIQNSFFVIKKRKSNTQYSKFAIIISRKFKLSSPARNKLRRRIYEILHHHLTQLNSCAPIHIAIIPKNKSLNLDYHELTQNLLPLLSKAYDLI